MKRRAISGVQGKQGRVTDECGCGVAVRPLSRQQDAGESSLAAVQTGQVCRHRQEQCYERGGPQFAVEGLQPVACLATRVSGRVVVQRVVGHRRGEGDHRQGFPPAPGSPQDPNSQSGKGRQHEVLEGRHRDLARPAEVQSGGRGRQPGREHLAGARDVRRGQAVGDQPAAVAGQSSVRVEGVAQERFQQSESGAECRTEDREVRQSPLPADFDVQAGQQQG